MFLASKTLSVSNFRATSRFRERLLVPCVRRARIEDHFNSSATSACVPARENKLVCMAEADSETPDDGADVTDVTPIQKRGTQNLSNLQRERIQRNKERAMSIRLARLQSNPYDVSHRGPQHISTGENLCNANYWWSMIVYNPVQTVN